MLDKSRQTQTQITTTVETITPLRAQDYLARNRGNRHMTDARVTLYASAMQRGEWQVNGEPIQFDNEGDLLNGQHRLHGCVRAGVPFTTLVVRGLPRGVFATLDTGKKRTAGDNIALLGQSDGNVIAAVAAVVMRYRTDRMLFGNWSPPNQDVVRFFENNTEPLIRSGQLARKARHIIQPGLGGGMHFLFAEKDNEMADRFMEDLASGASLPARDAVYVLREQLLANKTSKSKFDRIEICARTVRAWNARRSGSEVRVLRGTYGTGSEREFPKII